MKIGIIVYSETGHTYNVAKQLQKSLEKTNKVTLERIEIIRPNKKNRNQYSFKCKPAIKDYDLIIFGSFTEAFSLAPVMLQYLNSLNLSNKKVMCLITHYFPYAWMGGNRSLKQLQTTCEEQGANVLKTGIINWSHKKRIKDIDNLVKDFSLIK